MALFPVPCVCSLTRVYVPPAPTPHSVYEDRKERKGLPLKNSLNGPACVWVSTIENMYIYLKNSLNVQWKFSLLHMGRDSFRKGSDIGHAQGRRPLELWTCVSTREGTVLFTEFLWSLLGVGAWVCVFLRFLFFSSQLPGSAAGEGDGGDAEVNNWELWMDWLQQWAKNSSEDILPKWSFGEWSWVVSSLGFK